MTKKALLDACAIFGMPIKDPSEDRTKHNFNTRAIRAKPLKSRLQPKRSMG
jgi:hypothetical protein